MFPVQLPYDSEQFWDDYAYFSHYWGGSNVAVIIPISAAQSYWDDSLTSAETETGHVFTMAGYVGDPEQWKILDKEWFAVLKQFNVTHAHLTDFVARQKPFDNWDEPTRRAFLLGLAEAVSKANLFGVAANVHVEALEKANRRWSLDYNPYSVAAAFTMHAVCDHFYSGPDSKPIDIYIDRVEGGRALLDKAETLLKEDSRYRDWWAEEQVGWRHLTKPEMKLKPPAIQAADFHAWESRAYAETALGLSDKGKGSHWSGCRQSFIGLSEAAPVKAAIHSDLEINRVFKRLHTG
jgi:hypothetical protein